MEFPTVPEPWLTRVRAICLGLPQATEQEVDAGSRFLIRRRVFAHAFAMEDPEGRHASMLVCRAEPEERLALLEVGHPYFGTRRASDRVGIVLEDSTDWTEIAELITESYRLQAPKQLALEIEQRAF